MRTVSRRGFLVLGAAGAGGASLSACGSREDPREQGRDPELLAAALGAETAVQVAASAAAGEGSARARELVAGIAEDSSMRAERLRRLAESAGAARQQGVGGGVDSLTGALSASIAASRLGAGLLSTTELRSAVTANLVQNAAELAALRALAGDDPSPDSFVTGQAQQPFEAAAG